MSVLLLCSTWMDGPMSGLDPDVVENDVGVVWRTLYKLEKEFSERPNALKMAQKVKSRVDDFKEHSSLIAALFNPGLRERHWVKMSEIASQDLKPNEVFVDSSGSSSEDNRCSAGTTGLKSEKIH